MTNPQKDAENEPIPKNNVCKPAGIVGYLCCKGMQLIKEVCLGILLWRKMRLSKIDVLDAAHG